VHHDGDPKLRDLAAKLVDLTAQRGLIGGSGCDGLCHTARRAPGQTARGDDRKIPWSCDATACGLDPRDDAAILVARDRVEAAGIAIDLGPEGKARPWRLTVPRQGIVRDGRAQSMEFGSQGRSPILEHPVAAHGERQAGELNRVGQDPAAGCIRAVERSERGSTPTGAYDAIGIRGRQDRCMGGRLQRGLHPEAAGFADAAGQGTGLEHGDAQSCRELARKAGGRVGTPVGDHDHIPCHPVSRKARQGAR